jgi:hypothetical protein
VFFPGRRLGGVLFGQDAFGQVVHFLKVHAPCDRQATGAPEQLERSLRRLPFPPTALCAAWTFEALGENRPFFAHALLDALELAIDVAAETFTPPRARVDPLAFAIEPMFPVCEPQRRDRGRVVCPLFEQRALFLE